MNTKSELLMPRRHLRLRLLWLIAIVAMVFGVSFVYSQTAAPGNPPGLPQASQPAESQPTDGPGGTDRPPVMPAMTVDSSADSTLATSQPEAGEAPHGGYTIKDLLRAIAPALVAIILAMVLRQVIIALSAGILVAAVIMCCSMGNYNPVAWVTFAVDNYLFEVLAPLGDDGVDYDHMKIIIFTLFIGAMIGVIEANGGTRAMVARVTRRVGTRSKGQLGAFVAGLVVFFDDYANAMIVGPSMRPIFDRLRLSREKLAYIVDSTAAPVASIFVGTWLAYEISQLDEGFKAIGGNVPEFLAGVDGTAAFWRSIPYRTYAWLALVMVFVVALTGRDFGSMRKAESRAAAELTTTEAEAASEPRETGEGWWLGFVPVFVLVAMVIGLLFYSGWSACCADATIELVWSSPKAIFNSLGKMLGEADSYPALVYGSLCAMVVAVVTTMIARALPLAKTMDGMVSGMARMFTACIILVLAWGLSQGGKELQLGQVASAFLQQETGGELFPVTLLPLAIFITAGLVSFSTGTSYGTMAILCPVVIPISASLLTLAELPAGQAEPLFYAAVGAVLTGAVFGDHCSPISDTTVLSSIASECELSRHVWTQMPYAVVVAVVGILSTDGLNFAIERWTLPDFYDSYRAWSWAWGLGVGTVLLLLIVLIFGRCPAAVGTDPVIEVHREPQ